MKNAESNSDTQAEKNLPIRFAFQLTEQEIEDKMMASLEKYFSRITTEKGKDTKDEIKLYTRYEVAALFGVDPQTITDWVTYGILPKPLLFGKLKYFSHSQLQELIEKKQNESKK